MQHKHWDMLRNKRFVRAFARRPNTREPIVPMINVVFLLLVFLMLTARIGPPDPFDIALPAAGGTETELRDQPLYLSATGALAFGGLRDGEAIKAAAETGKVQIHADARAGAVVLARLLAELTAAGATQVDLITLGGAP